MDRRIGIRLAGLLAAAAVYVWAVCLCQTAEKGAQRVFLHLEQAVDTAAAEEIFTREGEADTPLGLCFWAERPEQVVTCRETGGSARVTGIFLAGNPEVLGAGSLAWQDGCLVDAQTAQALFGTTRCGAQTLVLDGRAYRVLGTVPALGSVVVTMAREDERLGQCVLWAPAQTGKVLGAQFLMRWGLRGTVLDFFPLSVLAHDLLLLLPGVLLWAAGGYLGRKRRKLSLSAAVSGRQWNFLAQTALGAVLAGAALWAMAKNLAIVPDMIPSRWSDFSFWGRWWAEQKENLLRILLTPLGNGQLQILLNMVKSMGNSTAAALLALWAVRRRKHADLADRG